MMIGRSRPQAWQSITRNASRIIPAPECTVIAVGVRIEGADLHILRLAPATIRVGQPLVPLVPIRSSHWNLASAIVRATLSVMKWHYVGRIFRFVGIRKLLLVLAAGAFLAGCASHVASTVVLPAVTRHGPPGSQFKASFPFPPIKSVTNGSGSTYRDFGVGFSTHTQYDSGVAPNEMDVSVTVLTKFVRPRRIDPFLRKLLSHSPWCSPFPVVWTSGRGRIRSRLSSDRKMHRFCRESRRP